MVIARYISKEIYSTFAVIMAILVFVALSNKFVMYLAKAASGKIPITLVFKIVGLFTPELFCVLAPMAMFIAVLFSHSRLHADNEVAVLFSCGYDWRTLIRTTMWCAAVMAVLVAVLNLYVVPGLADDREKLLANGQIAGVISAIMPGRFQTIDDNDQLVFYVENVLPDGSLRNIFIAQQPNSDTIGADKSIVVVTAKSAFVRQQQAQNEFYLVLHQGYRYVGLPGTANYTVTAFSEYGRELKYDTTPVPTFEYTRPMGEILSSQAPVDKAELQWRLSLPLAVLIVSLLAIPLAKVQPRQGRFARFLPAILIYMVYYNLLTVVKRLIAKGTLASLPGLWAVHIAFLLLAVALVMVVSGRFAEFKYKLAVDKKQI